MAAGIDMGTGADTGTGVAAGVWEQVHEDRGQMWEHKQREFAQHLGSKLEHQFELMLQLQLQEQLGVQLGKQLWKQFGKHLGKMLDPHIIFCLQLHQPHQKSLGGKCRLSANWSVSQSWCHSRRC
jgi:hypothetical protein